MLTETHFNPIHTDMQTEPTSIQFHIDIHISRTHFNPIPIILPNKKLIKKRERSVTDLERGARHGGGVVAQGRGRQEAGGDDAIPMLDAMPEPSGEVREVLGSIGAGATTGNLQREQGNRQKEEEKHKEGAEMEP
jgi:hypothetical protein